MERRSPQTRRDGRSSQTRGIRQQTRGRLLRHAQRWYRNQGPRQPHGGC